MRRFAALVRHLDTGDDQVGALRRYFASAPPADAAWGLHFLAGGRPRAACPTALLRPLACRRAGIDEWLFERCLRASGDLAETVAHVLPRARLASQRGLAFWVEQWLLPLQGMAPDERAARIADACDELDDGGRIVFLKLAGGGFRTGVDRLLVQRALAEHAGIDARIVALRMAGDAQARATPAAERFAALLARDPNPALDAGLPYPFLVARALRGLPAMPGPRADWLVEWAFHGLRAQLVKRAGRVWLWSSDGELVGDRFPELVAGARALPDGTVLDGDVLAWSEGGAMQPSQSRLQQRLGCKTPTKALLVQAPVTFVVGDLLEDRGSDLRGSEPQARRDRLQALLPAGAEGGTLRPPVRVDAADWASCVALHATARERGAQGLVFRRRRSHGSGDRLLAEGACWLWSADPLSAEVVLIYAEHGQRRRAGASARYTFAVWNRPPADADEARSVVDAIARREPPPDGASDTLRLVPVAKAGVDAGDEAFGAIDPFVRAHTLERFGPVRSVRPMLVFELGFESVHPSARHKSGIALRAPRLLRLRPDRPLHEADSLATLRRLIAPG
jgi:DNA ligase 1